MDDALLELAILGVLAEHSEIYPAHLIRELRRCAPSLPLGRARLVLERLYDERRVARLWHRYLLPDRVAAVRARWLAMLDRQERMPRASDPALADHRNARLLLCSWDGWSLD